MGLARRRPGGTSFNIISYVIKVHRSTFSGAVLHVCLPFQRGTTLEEKNLLLLGRILFLKSRPNVEFILHPGKRSKVKIKVVPNCKKSGRTLNSCLTRAIFLSIENICFSEVVSLASSCKMPFVRKYLVTCSSSICM